MADNSSPFSRLFNPVEHAPDTIFGMIGRASGLTTSEDLSGQAVTQLTKIMQDNPQISPQKAMLNWLSTPEGQEIFHQDPSILKNVAADFIKTVTPPNPVLHNVSEGQDVYQTTPGQTSRVGGNPGVHALGEGQTPFTSSGGQLTMGQQTPKAVPMSPGQTPTTFQNGTYTQGEALPTADVQSFRGFQDIARLNPVELASIAQDHMLPPEQRSASNGAIRELVRLGTIPRDVGLKLIGPNPVLDIKPITNPIDGTPTGQFVIIDKSNGSTKMIDPRMGEAGPQSSAQPTPVDTGSPSDFVRSNKATMFAGAGMQAIAQSYFGATARSAIDPAISDPNSEAASLRRDYIGQLRNAILNVKEGTASAHLKLRANEALNLAPGYGFMEDPKAATQKGLQLLDMVEGEMRNADSTLKEVASGRAPRAMGVDAAKSKESWARVQGALPTRAEMEDQIKKIETGGVGAAPTLKNTIGTAGNLGVKGLDEAGKVLGMGKTNSRVPTDTGAAEAMKIKTMPEADVLKLNPASLTSQGVLARGERIREINALRKPAARPTLE